MTSDRRELWRRAQWGWPVRFPVVQFPNAPLGVWIAGSLAAAATSGATADYATALARVGLVVWAYEELAHGVNGFRRVLGAGGLVYAVVAGAQALAR